MKKILLFLGMGFSLISCNQNMDEPQEMNNSEVSNPSMYAKKGSANKYLVSLDEATAFATQRFPIPIGNGPCRNRIEVPIFTPGEIQDVISILDRNHEPVMYLFNKQDNSGFLLMSASKLEAPILAYSNTSVMDLSDLPPALGAWIDLGVTKISQLNNKKQKVYYSKDVYDSWAAYGFTEPAADYYLGGPNGEQVTPTPMPMPIQEVLIGRKVGQPCVNQQTKIDALLGDIMWGQSKGYNKYQNDAPSNSDFYTPDYEYKYPAGCVPVAFGQIMKYHGNFGNLISNNQVANRVMSDADVEGVSIVLRKLFDIALHTFQNESGTALYTSEIARLISEPAFSSMNNSDAYNTFQYTASNSDFDYSEIHNNLRGELPVIVTGKRIVKKANENNSKFTINYTQNNQLFSVPVVSTYSGHAWVCDGYLEEVQPIELLDSSWTVVEETYDITRKFWHMNWGWHEKKDTYAHSNGWYQDDLFVPNYQSNNGTKLIDYGDNSDSGYHNGYYYKRKMVKNITPKL